MKKLLLFVSLVTVGAFATTRPSFGTQDDKANLYTNDNHNQPATRLVATYYPSTWKGVAIQPGDAGLMYSRTYLINYGSSTATLMNGPTYSMLALTASCRNEWLNSNIDPLCLSGCRTWSYYYSAAPSFTSGSNYLVYGCSDGEVNFK